MTNAEIIALKAKVIALEFKVSTLEAKSIADDLLIESFRTLDFERQREVNLYKDKYTNLRAAYTRADLRETT